MKASEKPVIICLTPVKNEAWIIERFLKCASTWADHIILADQNSEDETRTIISHFPKAQIIENTSEFFNEPDRQALLLKHARKIPGNKLLVALDADECLSANFIDSDEWNKLLELREGTSIAFDLFNLQSGMKKCWGKQSIIRGYMDDGTTVEKNSAIHSEKLPRPKGKEIFRCKEIKLLHYQYTDWERMKSKHRWYQSWETLNFPEKDPVSLYRTYYHMYAVSEEQLSPVDERWFKGYMDRGIDMFSVKIEEGYYWNDVIMEYFKQHGTNRFSKIAIWDKVWGEFDDPRSNWERLLHWYLKVSQPLSRNKLVSILDAVIKRLL